MDVPIVAVAYICVGVVTCIAFVALGMNIWNGE